MIPAREPAWEAQHELDRDQAISDLGQAVADREQQASDVEQHRTDSKRAGLTAAGTTDHSDATDDVQQDELDATGGLEADVAEQRAVAAEARAAAATERARAARLRARRAHQRAAVGCLPV